MVKRIYSTFNPDVRWGFNFQNETVRLVFSGLKTKHNFIIPYNLWTNWVIWRLKKEVMRVFKPLLSELRMEHSECLKILKPVQYALKNKLSSRNKNQDPIEILNDLI